MYSVLNAIHEAISRWSGGGKHLITQHFNTSPNLLPLFHTEPWRFLVRCVRPSMWHSQCVIVVFAVCVDLFTLSSPEPVTMAVGIAENCEYMKHSRVFVVRVRGVTSKWRRVVMISVGEWSWLWPQFNILFACKVMTCFEWGTCSCEWVYGGCFGVDVVLRFLCSSFARFFFSSLFENDNHVQHLFVKSLHVNPI